MKFPPKRFFARATLASLAGVVLAGCAGKTYSPLASPPPARAVSTPAESSPEVVTLPREPAPVIGLDHVDVDLPGYTPTNAPVTPPVTAFGRGWIPLTAWTERCQLGPPERIAAGGAVAWRIATKTGWCKLTAGTRLAQWNGVTLWLGFAPQLIQGVPHIHALDAQRTLLPLAEVPPRPAPGRRVVVLDPGHGGADGGTHGARGQLEKHYTLDWALRTERWLTNAGWKVVLTRRGDIELSLAQRIAVADRARADLFISLHFNSAFPQTQPSGIETYCLTPTGMPSTLARGYADDERAHFPNNAFDESNMAWAFRIHQALVAQTHQQDDGVKRARFMGVLRYQNRPAVLVEGGFLSNARDAASIHSAAHRENLARALAESLQ